MLFIRAQGLALIADAGFDFIIIQHFAIVQIFRDLTHGAARHNAMQFIKLQLLITAAVCFINGFLHGVRNAVCVQNRFAV